MTQRQFHVFRWSDFLTFGLAAILSVVLSCWASLTPGNPVVGLVVAWAASVGFTFVYAMILGRRIAFLRGIAYETVHGLVVMTSEWTPQRLWVERETERVAKLWGAAIEREGTPKIAVKPIVRASLRGVVVRWAKAPFTMHIRPAFKWMGLTSGSGESMMVGLVEPLERSALGHEIGHVILMHWRGDGTEETLEMMSKKYGVPY